MSWPLKYRPTTFQELALKDISAQLTKLFKSDSIPQVFLFAGPKGSGKTSTSRIISSVLNKSLDTEEHSKIFQGNSFIVNELDAASNRGIDDIRLLKERVSLPPQMGDKAVFILDEAHMLTREAFNALLKLLEEPPKHATFILATTELHKIPDTIVSRANVIKFRKATDDELRDVLAKILKKESIDFEDNAIQEVINRSGGSFRDAVKLLENVSRGEKKLSISSLEVLGNMSLQEELKLLVGAVLSKDEQKVVQIIGTFRENGEDEKYVYQTLFNLLHGDLMKSLGVQEGEAAFAQRVSLFLLDNLLDIPDKSNQFIPFLALEIRLLDLIVKAKGQGGGSTTKGIKKNPKPIPTTPIKTKQIVAKKQEIESDNGMDIVKSNSKPTSPIQEFRSDNLQTPSDGDMVDLTEFWDDFIQAVEQQNLTLAAIMKTSKLLQGTDGINRIGVYYKFHKIQLEQQKQLSILQDCAQSVAGAIPQFKFEVIENTQASEIKANELEDSVSEALM